MGGIRKSRGSLWLGIIGLAILLLGSVAPLWSLSHLSWRLVDQPAPAFWMSILLAIVGVGCGSFGTDRKPRVFNGIGRFAGEENGW